MSGYQPSPYVTWIKHLSDYYDKTNDGIICVDGDNVTILVHPSRPKVNFNISKNIYQELDKQDKTLQLYFYSLVWVLPVLSHSSPKLIDFSLVIIDKILAISAVDERADCWNMLWDDHAICERLCVLLEIKKFLRLDKIKIQLLNAINIHIDKIVALLEKILIDEKWHNNNHRIFHLLASFIYESDAGNENKKNKSKLLIESFINFLFNRETGFSLEQSIEYCFFDIAITKKVINSIAQISANVDIDISEIENNFNSHIAALSFPDGSLPASGDTPHGKVLPIWHLKRFSNPKDRHLFWNRLDSIGYVRGCSFDESVHFLTLAHNAESAHGHSSPLHTDVWFKDFGHLLVDSGGPFKYGSKLRFEWFKAAKGHNSLSIRSGGKLSLKNININPQKNRASFSGSAEYSGASHNRTLFSYSDELIIHEDVFSEQDFQIFYNFQVGCTIVKIKSGTFEISNAQSSFKIVLTTNLDPLIINIHQTERCTGHAISLSAPSLVVSVPASSIGYFLSFRKFTF